MTPRFTTTDESPNGSSLKGYITCSFDQLRKAFGEPDPERTDGYKVSTEWVLKDNVTGKIVTIYDYKATDLYGPGAPSVEAFRSLPSYEWHVGGSSSIDIDALSHFLGLI